MPPDGELTIDIREYINERIGATDLRTAAVETAINAVIDRFSVQMEKRLGDMELCERAIKDKSATFASREDVERLEKTLAKMSGTLSTMKLQVAALWALIVLLIGFILTSYITHILK